MLLIVTMKSLKDVKKRYDACVILETEPEIDRPVDDLPELRELMIPFGDSGYVALYRHEVIADTVPVLAFRHQKEAGY